MLEILRFFLRSIARVLFRVTVHGLDNITADKSVIICNHTSFLDGFLLSLFIERGDRRFLYALDTEQARRPVFRIFTEVLSNCTTVNQLNVQGIRTLIRHCQKNPTLWPMIFPEGRLSTTGTVMKVYPGAGLVAEKITDGYVLPVWIRGGIRSRLGRMQGRFRLFWFPKIHIHIEPRRKINSIPAGNTRPKYEVIEDNLTRLMEELSVSASHSEGQRNITQDFVHRYALNHPSQPLFCDYPTPPLSYRDTYRRIYALGKLIAAAAPEQARVGVMLPTSVGASVSFFACVFQGKTPVFLNPTVGIPQALSACKTVQLQTVFTAQRLLDRSEQARNIVDALRKNGVNVILLEDLRSKLTLGIKLKTLFASFAVTRASRFLPGYAADEDAEACILFTSGSEGMPKGVSLSHRNLISNCEQILTRLQATNSDVLLNALPIFHSFGLIGGVILPYRSGVTAVLFPTPLDYRLIPEIAYETNTTIFFSTDTFLANYAKTAHQNDFSSLHSVFAGAEKLKPATRQVWIEKFGVRVLEGYGVTETAPVISFNATGQCKNGSVGKPLPHIETRLESIAGVTDGGRLHVRGPNIMRGYYLPDNPGVLVPPPDGWHDTGDIATIGEDGYIHIVGRVKRFIKVAGEMVPLDGLEAVLAAYAAQHDVQIAAVGVADAKRGEKIVLVSTGEVDLDDTANHLKSQNCSPLWKPRALKVVAEIPLLASGKKDYPAITRLAQE